VGKGSTFWFTVTLLNIPAESSEPIDKSRQQYTTAEKCQSSVNTPVNAINSEGLRILVAEDNVINQTVCKGMLRKLGYSATFVSNGQEAIDEFNRSPFDIVLMDCQMPEMDGFEATKTIRKNEPDGKHIPIIAMTANAFQSDKDNCAAAGMDGHFSKPFTQQELNDVIQQWIPKRNNPTVNVHPAPDEGYPLGVIEYSMIDVSRADDIIDSDIMNVKFLQNLLVQYFSEDVPEKIHSLHHSSAIGDVSEIKRITHSLRGSSAQLGAVVAAKQCERIETSIANNELRDIPDMITHLETIFRSTKIELDNYLHTKEHHEHTYC
jgi:CheY-like chemotaxis protein/HPt (histidine-containing phosphotransfer) domain-containing protein